MPGSPPRARGRPSTAGWSTCGARAHPRVRGDVLSERWFVGGDRGSPPRARGRPVPDSFEGTDDGLTPACAGTSWRWWVAMRRRWAHPRVRGDVCMSLALRRPFRGSPPRARGRPGCVRGLRPGHGLTPACAGTSVSLCPPQPPSWAHPRVRGDVVTGGLVDKVGTGSPPRARGRQTVGPHDDFGGGLTPACAGTSPSCCSVGSRWWAHPRVRGDVTRARMSGWIAMGSPPRARGRRSRVMFGARENGGSPPRARGRPKHGC